jgi:hypothetical protein
VPSSCAARCERPTRPGVRRGDIQPQGRRAAPKLGRPAVTFALYRARRARRTRATGRRTCRAARSTATRCWWSCCCRPCWPCSCSRSRCAWASCLSVTWRRPAATPTRGCVLAHMRERGSARRPAPACRAVAFGARLPKGVVHPLSGCWPPRQLAAHAVLRPRYCPRLHAGSPRLPSAAARAYAAKRRPFT